MTYGGYGGPRHPRCGTCTHPKRRHEWQKAQPSCYCCHDKIYIPKAAKARKRPRPRALTEHAELVKQADDLWRLIIRARTNRCEVCTRPDPGGTQPRGFAFQAAHGIRRTRLQTRWDLDNGWKLCQGCHTRFTFNDEAWQNWMRQEMGEERYQALRLRSETRGQKVDLKMIIVGLTQIAMGKKLL